jgi:hypothetical protein
MTEPTTAGPLEFTTPAKDRPADTIPVRIDGVAYQARRPKDAVVAQLGPVLSRRTAGVTKMGIVLDFLADVLIEPGRTVLTGRLLDGDDDFDVTDAVQILLDLAAYWKAHPPAPAAGVPAG